MTKMRTFIPLLTAFVAALALGGSLLFSTFVTNSLWDKSVTDVLEVTTQGQNAFDTFFEKDLDTLDLFVDELSAIDPADGEALDQVITLFDQNDAEGTYLSLNLSNGEVRRSSTGAHTISKDQVDNAVLSNERGVLNPFLDEVTGVNMIGVYEKFTFADGTLGLARKARPLQEVADRFSLSFYDDTGFSYVVNADGDIVVRSSHRNSNRTIANLFDLVQHEGNDDDVVASFKAALNNGKRGVAVFTYLDEEYVFCYTPLASTAGWNLVSIIPNKVIMQQANAVIQATFALCAVIVVGLLIILGVYWRSSRAHRKQIEQMAYFDKLTGLFSTDKFEIEGNRMLKAARERAEREVAPVVAGAVPGVAAAYLNIADFKLINDVDGYHQGDEVLRQIAAIVRDEAGPQGIACRTAADHFVMLYPYDFAAEAPVRCGRAIERARSIVAAGKPLSLHAGICCSDDAVDATTVTELVDRARLAKTEARRRGRHICLFNSSMREDMLRRAEIERTMEAALEAGEFFPLIQPKFSTDGTRVLGGEALVRWNRPGKGIVSPAEFIPLFEQNGFIVRLDEFMFEAVCRSLRERLDAGLPVVPVSVNVSRLHLHRSSFVPTYLRIKQKYNIPDELTELELTESMVLEDLQNAVYVIDELREAGFGCSIDDFGSGQSSLNALKELPADVLKLDRAFLLEHDHSIKEEVVVRTVIDMARKLDMRTVMEGVETHEQLEFIKTTSCDMIQGFVFSRPVPVEDFYHLLDGAA